MTLRAVLLVLGSAVLSAVGVTLAHYVRRPPVYAPAVLLIGLALCMCIEAGRNWT